MILPHPPIPDLPPPVDPPAPEDPPIPRGQTTVTDPPPAPSIDVTTPVRGASAAGPQPVAGGIRTFTGSPDGAPTNAEDWLRDTKRRMDHLGFDPAKKYQGAISMLDEYELEFLRLLQYGSSLVPTESDRCQKFREGLQIDILKQVATYQDTVFDVLVERAKAAEEVELLLRQTDRVDRERPRRPYGPVSRGDSSGFTSLPPCEHCGNKHGGECRMKTGACFRCGSSEHFLRDCPQPSSTARTSAQTPVRSQTSVQTPARGRSQSRVFGSASRVDRSRPLQSQGPVVSEARQPALVYATRRRDDRDEPDVIAGQLGIVDKVYQRCPLMVQDEIFPADLMELPLEEFDLILGMDWLFEHRVTLDCESKIATLKTLDNRSVILVGERRGYLSNVVSVLTADRMIWKGYEVFLTTILSTKGSLSQMEEIRTVREFPDVFPEELPGLPPG
ncbi:hypothetical protein V6N12_065680 [Hibiscus sabdariffa]|uniref:CCHC-type domain-containing protein n=1 Tax=Hibiscus sabdariffa TaxID=183260 RepID=A0ABR2G9F2_9ROSI